VAPGGLPHVTTILLLGKTGQVGHELQRSLAPLGTLAAPERAQLDIADPDAIRAMMRQVRPDVVVNAAGLTNVDAAEAQPELAMQINATAPGVIAEVAKSIGALLVHYSTSFVFDGGKREPYTEEDRPNPINAYGRSKLAGEQAIQACGGNHIIIRANWTYSSRRTNFVLKMLELARSKTEIKVVDDQIGAPTWAREYADATALMLKTQPHLRERSGIYNLSAGGQCTRHEWAALIIESAKTLTGAPGGWAALARTTTREYAILAPRPLYTVTNNNKIRDMLGVALKSWGASMTKHMQEHFGKPL
jgi:dTDP-4-dehydrorhamnose reductase